MPNKPSLCLVTPALADANNGNWQTAKRWARHLAGHYRVRLESQWTHGNEDLLLALHARRSAASVAAFAGAHPARGLLLALTGTDLYGDIDHDAAAQRSLALATRLIVLQELGDQAVPERWRDKCRVCFQSTTTRATLDKTRHHLRAVMVGHLREVKSPQTYFDAALRLAQRSDILLDHVGDGLDPKLAEQAQALSAQLPTYRWLGGMPHAAVRARIQRAHVLVHPSRIEGGAHVVMEAVCSGTPVLASRIPGNVGMLGPDYAGYFQPGDAEGLALALQRCRDDPAMLDTLRAQCARRAPLFAPARERDTLLRLCAQSLEMNRNERP